MLYKRIPTQAAIAAFPDPSAADNAAEELAIQLMDESIVCTNLAVVSKSKDAKIKIKEHGKNGPINGFLEGGVGGAVVGGIFGVQALALLGPIGSAVGGAAGGLVGGAVGCIHGTIIGTAKGLAIESMDKKNLKALGAGLEPGSSLMIAFFGEVVVKKSEFQKHYRAMEHGAEGFVEKTAANISAALKQKRIFGMTVALDDDSMSVTATQTTLSSKAINLVALLMTPDGEKIVEAAVNEGGEEVVAGAGVTKEEGVYERGAIVATAKESTIIYEI